MPQIVSNSNIETFQKCEKMFDYSVVRQLTPKLLPIAIRRGSFGHEMMEEGFKELIATGDKDAAIQAAAIPVERVLTENNPDAVELIKVYRHVTSFIEFTQRPDIAWRPVALEDKGLWEVNDGLTFGFTPDIVIEFTKGLYRGQSAVLDYKFLGQYMQEHEINMAQQIPKYIIYRNKMHPETKIHRGAFVQLNTRATPDDRGHKLFLMKWIEPSKQRLKIIEHENEIMMQRVANAYDKKPDEFIHTVNKSICKFCFFAHDLCPAELDGLDTKKIIEREYKINDYGY